MEDASEAQVPASLPPLSSELEPFQRTPGVQLRLKKLEQLTLKVDYKIL